VSGYLTDTSIFIAAELGRPLGSPPPGQCRVSVATLTELLVGAELAHGSVQEKARERTLAKARSFVTLPFDEPVAEVLARLLAGAKKLGRRAPLADAIVAATALVHDLTVWTQDEDFEVLAEIEPELRVQVG
jgi:predicted nucleic acid-binding protein